MSNLSSTAELMVSRETIGVTLDVLGGHRAISKLPDGYDGKCKVIGDDGETIGIFPNRKEAYSVARYAIFPDGGYGPEVTVLKAKETEEITHETLEDWI